MLVFDWFGAGRSTKIPGFLPEDRSLDADVGKRKDAADDRTSIDTTWTSIDRDLIELGDEQPTNRPARCVFSLAMLFGVYLLGCCCDSHAAAAAAAAVLARLNVWLHSFRM